MPEIGEERYSGVVERLVALYDEPFGGKPRGRYRISMKLMCRLMSRRRLWPEEREAVRRAMYERGYLLVDMETYFVVISQQTFGGYRRVNDAGIAEPFGWPDAGPTAEQEADAVE